MPLNTRQERFAQNLVAKAMNATAAYKAAGYAAKTDATARAGASELLTNPEVKARVAELQAKASQRNEITVDAILRELDEARLGAMMTNQYGAAVQASLGRAKIAGLITDKAELLTTVLRKPLREPLREPNRQMSLQEWERRFKPTSATQPSQDEPDARPNNAQPPDEIGIAEAIRRSEAARRARSNQP
ncbi:terminase small subunit [Mesorhizobium kowhaii]|uniref:Terminase n=1 Tax=Mesorhizobium kowhaii TaxID=1300272 RepID=A0A2W7C5V3_9HYPH|nr:terminase small subunit [Mesorhizobium kowhaii]PZV38540.1 hypothetical protein B5V02_10830 [Mesorhizobium kowhaii]